MTRQQFIEIAALHAGRQAVETPVPAHATGGTTAFPPLVPEKILRNALLGKGLAQYLKPARLFLKGRDGLFVIGDGLPLRIQLQQGVGDGQAGLLRRGIEGVAPAQGQPGLEGLLVAPL